MVSSRGHADVRPGNPKGFQDWNDLTAEGVGVLTPDPASSGGARWNLVSVWGSALNGYAGVEKGDEAGAEALINGVVDNVIAFDKSARDSIKNFEAGNGDLAITYENEVLVAQAAGQENEGVYLPSSVLMRTRRDRGANITSTLSRGRRAFRVPPHPGQELYRTVSFLRPTDIEMLASRSGRVPRDGTSWFGGWTR
jgi:sulfate transport system substrate-binding protein